MLRTRQCIFSSPKLELLILFITLPRTQLTYTFVPLSGTGEGFHKRACRTSTSSELLPRAFRQSEPIHVGLTIHITSKPKLHSMLLILGGASLASRTSRYICEIESRKTLWNLWWPFPVIDLDAIRYRSKMRSKLAKTEGERKEELHVSSVGILLLRPSFFDIDVIGNGSRAPIFTVTKRPPVLDSSR